MTARNEQPVPRVVVGVDESDASKDALRWAGRIAGWTGAELDIVEAWHLPTSYGWGAVPLEWSPTEDIQKSLTVLAADAFGADRPAEVRVIVREGNATQVLLEEGKGALMLVGGSRGHGGFAGLLLGSVSAKVAEHAQCPVLVVHGTKAVAP